MPLNIAFKSMGGQQIDMVKRVDLKIYDSAAPAAKKVIVGCCIPVKAVGSHSCGNLVDLPQFCEQRQIAVNCTQAYVGILFPDMAVDCLSSGVIIPCHQKVPDRFTLTAVFNHVALPSKIMITITVLIYYRIRKKSSTSEKIGMENHSMEYLVVMTSIMECSMPDIKRFVTYLYYYENNQKLQMAGFAKVEIRGGQCRMEIHLKAAGLSGSNIPIYLFARERGKMIALEIGQMTPGQMSGEYKALLKCSEIGHSSYQMQDICGMLLLLDDVRMYASCWDEGDIRRESIEIYEPQVSMPEPKLQAANMTEEQPVILMPGAWQDEAMRRGTGEAEENTQRNLEQSKEEPEAEAKEQRKEETEQCVKDEGKEPQQKQEQPSENLQPEQKDFPLSGWDRPQEESTLQAEELPMRKIIMPDFGMRDTIWQNWEQIKNKMTILHPIEGENITCVHMELRDIRELPRKYWYLGNNSFLLHGFFNYRYLLFGERVCDGKKELFLGVPGVFQQQEKVMAAIFGFPQFIPEKPAEHKEQHFGYWCHIIT